MNWLPPGLASILETALGYEQMAVDRTAWVARDEMTERREASKQGRGLRSSAGLGI